MTVLLIAFSIWSVIYLAIGWLISSGMDTGQRILWTFCWLILPAVVNALHEEPPDNHIEGNCICKKRAIQDAGGKWCSVCGGKIKDKVWKRRYA